MRSYIYKITNLVNNKVYVGQFTGEECNWVEYWGGGNLIRQAIKKYGKSNFRKDIIIQGIFNAALLNDLERHYIRLYSPPKSKMSYNIDEGGNSGTTIKKPIYQYSLTGEFIKEWPSGSNACKFFNTRASNLHSAALGTILTSNGFIWTYEMNKDIVEKKLKAIAESNKKLVKRNSKNRVFVYDNNDWLEFVGTVKPAQYLGISSIVIRSRFKKQDFFWIKDKLVAKSKLETLPPKNNMFGYRKVIKLDECFNILAVYNSRFAAEKDNKLCRTILKNKLAINSIVEYAGFYWKYAE